jgi:hypothetical protein
MPGKKKSSRGAPFGENFWGVYSGEPFAEPLQIKVVRELTESDLTYLAHPTLR